MGLFSKKRSSDADEGALTLVQAWTLLGEQLGLTVESPGEDAVHADGMVHGRSVDVEITADPGSALADGISDFTHHFTGRRRKGGGKRRTWRTVLSVSCTNPRGLAGTITSAVDLNDPDWDPRNFDPAHCRAITVDPPELAAVLTPAVRDRLMQVMGDVAFTVDGQRVVLAVDNEARVDAGYIAGSIIHQLNRSIPTWPERGTAGPPWWIDTVCALADAIDAA